MQPVMANDASAVLELRNLRRTYGRFRKVAAVRDVSFAARRGEIFGLIGPDGAGKTTIIQVLAGVLRPSGGSARVESLDVATDAERIKPRIGYMPQGLGSNLYDSLTVRENVEFFRDLRQLPEDLYQRNFHELLAATRLEPFLDRRAATLSGGMRQKLALICTLIHLPDILLLDEPTTGVDPISRQEFWQIIGRLVDGRRATVLVSTSYMDEAERCHRIALLHDGAVIAEGAPADVRARACGRFARIVAVPQSLALDALRHRNDVRSTEVFGDELHINFDGELREIESALIDRHVAVSDITVEEPRLEDVFLQLLGGTPRDEASVTLRSVRHPVSGPSIDCRDVSRRFGSFTAVDHIDLTVRQGEIYGLLGPNGAGKTTLIKMMCGLLEPSAGTITVGGIAVRNHREQVRSSIGYMSQRFSLYPDLTVRQNLRLYADLYDLDLESHAALVTRLGLDPFTSRLARDLPIGMRQRLSLLCAVLHGPAIVFLDEPTSGVDPRARRTFWDLIYSLSRDAGITVLVSTHYMDEAAHCDRLGLVHQGRLIAEGSPAAIKAGSEQVTGKVLAVRTADPGTAFQLLRQTRPHVTLFGDHLRVRSLDVDGDHVALAAELGRKGLTAVRIEPRPLSMDEAFIDFVSRAEAARA
jgi:ABC-2 type transport system ATP-binding protein